MAETTITATAHIAKAYARYVDDFALFGDDREFLREARLKIAEYTEHEATFVIETLGYLSGELPRRARTLVVEWALQHRDELREDWERARQGQPLLPIPPLD